MKRKAKKKPKPGTWDGVRVSKRATVRKDGTIYFDVQFPNPTTFCVIKDFR
jgi:hypothetical protein